MSGSTTFEVHAPKDEKLLWNCSGATTKEANEAIESSQRAFKSWRKTKPPQIRNIFLKAADIMERRLEELAGYQMEETGAPEFIVKHFNLPTTIEMLRDIAGRVSSAMTGSMPSTEGGGAFVFKEPYGVILGIAPWYAQYQFAARVRDDANTSCQERTIHPRTTRLCLRHRLRKHLHP